MLVTKVSNNEHVPIIRCTQLQFSIAIFPKHSYYIIMQFVNKYILQINLTYEVLRFPSPLALNFFLPCMQLYVIA